MRQVRHLSYGLPNPPSGTLEAWGRLSSLPEEALKLLATRRPELFIQSPVTGLGFFLLSSPKLLQLRLPAE